MGGKSKDEIFDDFISDLFTNKLNITTSVKKSLLSSENKNSSFQGGLPLDQTLMISTAKK